MAKNCKDCKWWGNKDYVSKGVATCKRHSPIIVLDSPTGSGVKDIPFTCWPTVYEDNWCGDFEEKEKPLVAKESLKEPV